MGISREKITAMVSVLNERWLAQGWRAMDRKDAEPMALIWINHLDADGVPYSQYRELYIRGVQLRASRLAQGLKCDDFSVEMMLACWPALRRELREKEVAAGRTLTAQAESICTDCYGTGRKIIKDAEGKTIGAGPTCHHDSMTEGERTMEGFTDVEEVLNRPVPEETAVDICSRIRQQLAWDVVRSEDEATRTAAWDASRTWSHAEKYCRENG